MKGELTLEGMEFLCRHGCLPQEKENDNLFVVNFSGTYDMTAAASSDALSDAIDCALIYRTVAREMEIPANLLEHLCTRICDALAGAFPGLESFSVEVCKRNPPLDGTARWSKVKMSR